MLTKYELIHVPAGGVDHLINGERVSIDYNLSDEMADRLAAKGLKYFKLKPPLNPETNGNTTKAEGRTGQKTQKRNSNGRFLKTV